MNDQFNLKACNRFMEKELEQNERQNKILVALEEKEGEE